MADFKEPLTGAAAEQGMRRLTRRSFLVGGVAAAAALGGWRWLTKATAEDGVPWPLRRFLEFNQGVATALGGPRRLAPTFPPERVQGPARTNGMVGLENPILGWQLRVEHEGRGAQTVRLLDFKKVGRTDLVTELKCVEGWSEVMHFGG